MSTVVSTKWQKWHIFVFQLKYMKTQPDLTAIPTYYTRWLIRATALVHIHKIFAKSYVFYELAIRMNLYE